MINKIKKIYNNNQEIINYIIVGGLTTVVSLGVYYGLVLTILDPKDAISLQIANIVSWIAAVTFAYFSNRILVFKSKNKHIFKEAIQFYGSRLLTLFLDMFFMFMFVTIFKLNDKLCKILVQFIILVLNYIISKFFVFYKKK